MNRIGERVGMIVGRALLALIFIASGFGKLNTPEQTDGYIRNVFASQNIPESLVVPARWAAIVFEIVGGVLVLLGLWARLGALMLMVFLILASVLFHRFWEMTDPVMKQMQMINFMKNISILGGLTMVLARGSGMCSVDNFWRSGASPGGSADETGAASTVAVVPRRKGAL